MGAVDQGEGSRILLVAADVLDNKWHCIVKAKTDMNLRRGMLGGGWIEWEHKAEAKKIKVSSKKHPNDEAPSPRHVHVLCFGFPRLPLLPRRHEPPAMSQEPENHVLPEDSLVLGRAKRATAGNRMQALIQHIDDEDLRNDLLQEDETDQQDYQLSDTEDVAFGSSDDDDDDEGPPRDGQDEDLTGEQELQKQQRLEARKKKRKAHDFANIPLNPLQKRQRLVAQNSLLAPRPRKKSERISWLPTTDDAPTRSSLRRQTVANKEQTEAKLKESQKRSEKAHELMKIAAEKKAASAVPALTQADRMARALKVEKENSRTLNRWEKAEEERQLAQQARLEALRDRQLEGPVFRYWSGSVIWQGDKIRVKRVHQPKIEPIVEIAEQPPKPKPASATHPPASTTAVPDTPSANNTQEVQPADSTETQQLEKATTDSTSDSPATTQPPGQATRQDSTAETVPETLQGTVETTEEAEPMAVDVPEKPDQQETVQQTAPSSKQQPSFLDGIHYWASQSPEASAQKNQNPSLQAPTPDPDPQSLPPPTLPPQTTSTDQPQPPLAPLPAGQPKDIAEQPSAPLDMQQDTQNTPLQSQPLAQPQPPPAPLLREQAQRSLVILEAFPDLEPTIPALPTKKSASSTAVIASVLLPDALPTLSAQETKYLTSKSAKKKEFLPPPPPKPVCAITGKPARFRDPKTNIAYKDLVAYKALQRVAAGGTAWSALFDSWMGIVGQGPMGRVARGVPECFWTGRQDKAVKDEGLTNAVGAPAASSSAIATPANAS